MRGDGKLVIAALAFKEGKQKTPRVEHNQAKDKSDERGRRAGFAPGVIHCLVCFCVSSVALPPGCLSQMYTLSGFDICMCVYVCFYVF